MQLKEYFVSRQQSPILVSCSLQTHIPETVHHEITKIKIVLFRCGFQLTPGNLVTCARKSLNGRSPRSANANYIIIRFIIFKIQAKNSSKLNNLSLML